MTENGKDMGPDGNQASAASPQASGEADADQLLYARILAKGMYLGLGLLLVTFALYMTGIMQPGIPIEELPRFWTMSAYEYLEAVNHEFLHRPHVVDGWGWVAMLGKGDYVNFIGIAILSAVTIVCYLGILPSLLRKKDWIYAAIAVAEVIVLVLAASGLVAVGH
jgi:hypothetical protein